MQSSLLPTKTMRETALEKIDAINLSAYARTRNALDGRVTKLSPYLTHGITDVPEVIQRIGARTTIGWEDKFSFELGWREYFHHVWGRLGDDIWVNQTPPPASQYKHEMPSDILSATTGVDIIDSQIRTLYETGDLHNHARMWLASYVVHVRKIDWRVGARWLYGYLRDGDMASNTLSWQWVAGTWTGKPYLFNAENVVKYAPASNNVGSVIDVSYEVMDNIARSDKPTLSAPQGTRGLVATVPPALLDSGVALQIATTMGFTIINALPINQAVWLCHPWSIQHVADDGNDANGAVHVGFIVTEFHAKYPWSKARWHFVLGALREITDIIFVTAAHTKTSASPHINVTQTHNSFYTSLIQQFANHGARIIAAPRAFINPEKYQRSFSSFWHKANKEKFPI